MTAASGQRKHPRYPLRASKSQRYLEDQDGTPTFVNGDTAWSMVVSLLPDEWELYLADREARGVTAIIVNAIERLFTADAPRTIDGLEPFTTPEDLSTPNDEYFDRVDALIRAAAGHGIEVYLVPLYLGYPDADYPGWGPRFQGWHDVIVANGMEKVRGYGEYLGRRFGSHDNITWVMGGDRNPDDVREHVRAFAAGILSKDDRHLMTAHCFPDAAAMEEYEADAWLTLNQTYTYRIVHQKLLEDYTREPVRPFVLFESTYEREHDSTELQIRRQAWWALTRCAAGQFIGSFPMWTMAPGWDAMLDSPGARDLGHISMFVDAIRWWELVPDLDHGFLVAGLGSMSDLDRATAAIAADGSLAVIYVPSMRTLTLNMGRLSGYVISWRWFQPSTGLWVDGETMARGGFHQQFRQIETPGPGDWVLVLEDPAHGRHGKWPALGV